MANSFFPSRTITIYMARMFLVRSLSVMGALVLILQTLDLLGESGNIMAHTGNGGGQLWTYISLRAPQIVAFVLPFSVLLGTLITLATMNQNSEIVSMKGAGLSAHQILAPLFAASMLVAAVSFVFNDRIVSRATATLTRWQKADYGPLPSDRKGQTNIWVRDGDDLIHAETVTGRGASTTLNDVTVYDREGGSLMRIIHGARAAQSGAEWQLEAASTFDVARGTRETSDRLAIGKGVRPDQFTLANVNADDLSLHGLYTAIQDLKAAGRPTSELEAGWWHKIAKPLSSMLMPLLGAVAGFGIARSGRLFVRAAVGMGLGFAYFVADNFGLAMGSLGAYPPLLAAWGPFFLFLLIGESVLIQTEE